MNSSTASKKLLLVQLNRFGDILQTIHAAIGVKAQFAGFSFEIAVRKEFGSHLFFLLDQVFDQVHVIDRSILIDRESNIDGCIKKIDQHLNSINIKSDDVVLNLSFCKTSSYYCSLFKTKHKLGLFRTEDHGLAIEGAWFQYVYATLMTGDVNDFNLVDLFRLMIGNKQNLIDISPKKTSKGKYIVVHPFASSERKRWASSKWKEYIFQLLSKNSDSIVKIVGSPSEEELANQIVTDELKNKFRNRIVSLVGKTNIEQLFNELQKADLFVGHDSMVGHLAAISGTPSITLSLGSVRPVESVPYLQNNLVIAPQTKCFPCFPDTHCEYFSCHKDISPSVLRKSTEHWLGQRSFEIDELIDNFTDFENESVDLSVTKFSDQSMLYLDKTSKRKTPFKQVFRTLNRFAWYLNLEGKEEKALVPKPGNETLNRVDAITKTIEQAYELNNFGTHFTKCLIQELAQENPNYENVTNYSNKIEEIETLFRTLVQNDQTVSGILNYFFVKRSNIKNTSILDISKQTLDSFIDCNYHLKTLYELIEYNINESQSRANL